MKVDIKGFIKESNYLNYASEYQSSTNNTLDI